MNATKGVIYSSCIRAQVPVRKRFICMNVCVVCVWCVCVCVCVCVCASVCVRGVCVCVRARLAHSFACTLVDVYTLYVCFPSIADNILHLCICTNNYVCLCLFQCFEPRGVGVLQISIIIICWSLYHHTFGFQSISC